MAGVQVLPPFPVFYDRDGEPLEDGYIWIGPENLNPLSIQIPVYWDAALSIPALQPVRTLNGYPSRDGTPANLFSSQPVYAITVQNKNQAFVYQRASSRSATDFEQQLASQDPASNGTTLIGYRYRDLNTRLLEDASLFDFMTEAQRLDALSGSPVLDHTAAVQTAFLALGSQIRNLKINDGATFRVNDTATVTSQTGFRVYGKGLIRQFTANKPILHLITCVDFEVDGPRFYGLGTDFTPLVDTGRGDGIHADRCQSFAIHHCKFTNFGSTAIRTLDGLDFRIEDNEIHGTQGLSAAIAHGDLYQFGVLAQSNWPLNQGPTRFAIDRNTIRNVAIGIRVEPKARYYSCDENIIQDIKGNHGMYLNGADFTASDNRLFTIEIVGIKCQSFWNASGPATDPIQNAVIANNVIHICESGIHVEKNDTNALKSDNVVITGNNVLGALATGSGILCQDVGGIVVDGNQCTNGFYGIIANQFGVSTAACSGRIANNVLRDSVGPAIFVNTDYLMEVEGNLAIRPCLGASPTPGDTAFYLTGTTAAKRIRAEGNSLFVDTSGGVSHAIRALNVALALGNNDRDGKLLDTTGSTLRQRGLSSDFIGRQAWGSAPNISAGATVTINITVTGAQAGDEIVYLSHASDLQGCILSGNVVANQLNVSISNVTGGAKVIADGILRWAIQRKDT